VLILNQEILTYIAVFSGFTGLVLSAAVLIYILRWRMAFVLNDNDGAKRFALIPDDVLNENNKHLKTARKALKDFYLELEELTDRSTLKNESIVKPLIASHEQLKEDQRKVFQVHQESLKVLAELKEETNILRSEIQTQARELDRHREGYDTDILKASLIPVARMHRMIRKDLQNEALSEEARQTLEALEDEHLEVLETKGVKLVPPPIGAKHREQKNIKHPPQVEPATDESLAGTIKTVLSPAYELETSARNIVLLEAQVVVYSAAQEPAFEHSGADPELNQGN